MSTVTDRDVQTASTGELAARVSRDIATLVRDELKLAQLETTSKAKKLGLGAGLLGGAGAIAFFGGGAFVAAAILGLAIVVPGWLAAVIVGGALILLAGMFALAGKKGLSAGGPPVPTEAVDGVKTDVHTIQQAVRR